MFHTKTTITHSQKFNTTLYIFYAEKEYKRKLSKIASFVLFYHTSFQLLRVDEVKTKQRTNYYL